MVLTHISLFWGVLQESESSPEDPSRDFKVTR